MGLKEQVRADQGGADRGVLVGGGPGVFVVHGHRQPQEAVVPGRTGTDPNRKRFAAPYDTADRHTVLVGERFGLLAAGDGQQFLRRAAPAAQRNGARVEFALDRLVPAQDRHTGHVEFTDGSVPAVLVEPLHLTHLELEESEPDGHLRGGRRSVRNFQQALRRHARVLGEAPGRRVGRAEDTELPA